MWEPDKYLQEIYTKNKIEYSFNAETRDQWAEWRSRLKEVFINDLGGFPVVKAPLNSKVLEEKEFNEYTRQRISFTSEEGLDVPAYLLIPRGKTGKLPAVIACHGHGYGSREIAGLSADGSENTSDTGYQKNFAVELVKRGMIVIVPDLLGFGDARLKEDEEKPLRESSCHRISTYLLMMGKTTAGLRVYEAMRAVDYLCSREDVDMERIGCMGISGGGLVCAFTSAIDERIKAAVVSGYTNTFKDSVMSIHHCIDNFIPGIVKHAEMPDIIGMIAPRPLLIEAGRQDDIFPISSTMKAYSALEKIYNLLDAGQKLDIDVFEGSHQISGRKAYDFLEKQLYCK